MNVINVLIRKYFKFQQILKNLKIKIAFSYKRFGYVMLLGVDTEIKYAFIQHCKNNLFYFIFNFNSFAYS
jgi:hypothetical protein